MQDATPTSAVLELIELRRTFRQGAREIHVLDGAAATLRAGQAVALVGPSGAGKSTLLHVAGLLETPDSGQVIVNGRNCAGMDDSARTRVRRAEMGFVYQFHQLLPEFSAIETQGKSIRAAGGAQLFDLIAGAVRAGLGGLETLVGIRGTVGGSVRCNVGDRSGEIGSCVRRVAVLNDDAIETIRTRDELTFGDHSSDLDEPVILWVEFELTPEKPQALLKRMRRAWIIRKAAEPLSFQAGVRMFRDPAGQSAGALIERAGLAKFRVGSAEISDRNGNYAIAHPGTTAKDVLKLIDHVRAKVKDSAGVTLERELNVW